jgi:hypothetical protein
MGVSNVRDRRGIGPESGGGGQKGCSPRLGLLGSNATGALGCASLETVLESSGHILEVASAAGTDGLSSLSLLGPVVLADLGSRVTARRALMLLDVKRAATASSAQGVRLVVTLTEAGGTLRHLGCGVWAVSWMAIEKFSVRFG